MDLKIVVASHKEYDMPKEDHYLPVFVGAAVSDLDLPYQRDDDGENISDKNSTYCELTGLYWAYRNLKADYLGLCHYHRYMDIDDIDIGKYDVILPKKRHYYIETVYDQYRHAHGSEGLDIAREIIEKDYPEYLESFDECMNRRSLHLFNMFIMKYGIFVDYCEFLFDILFKIEKRMGNVERIYGHISERLLDVYLERNHFEYKEVNLIEKERINWPKKIFIFLKRKYLS